MARLFGTDGVRGVANEELTPLMAMQLGQAGAYVLTNVREIFPENLAKSLELGIKSFDRQIHGFANPDTILSGVESRTSSPVRIWRNEEKEIENTGIYPCGEGAGYAGGIMSAAMDGLKVAESIGKKFMPFRQR